MKRDTLISELAPNAKLLPPKRRPARTYTVHSLFLTLQGEGSLSGMPALFVRFSGCNVWNGREKDRHKAKAACGSICDTKFVGIDPEQHGGKYGADQLVTAAVREWGAGAGGLVVFTGGEPLLQLDIALISAFIDAGFLVSIETNGTVPYPRGVYPSSLVRVTVSPKYGELPIVRQQYTEVKLLWPLYAKHVEEAAELADIRWLQPVDMSINWAALGPGKQTQKNTEAAAAKALELRGQGWRLGLQAHKYAGIL